MPPQRCSTGSLPDDPITKHITRDPEHQRVGHIRPSPTPVLTSLPCAEHQARSWYFTGFYISSFLSAVML